ncbi:hypothetical protein CBS9595_003921 [Malassezia furfur]|nr:hypothetical protein CBS9595_003921 [Malassezia furfur]
MSPSSPPSAARGAPHATPAGRSTSTPHRVMPKPLRTLSLDASAEDAARPSGPSAAPRGRSSSGAPADDAAASGGAPDARPWSPTRALGRSAAYAAQSLVDVLTRSLSPTLYAASLFESPTIASPTQAAAFHEVFGERTDSPETMMHAARPAPRSTGARAKRSTSEMVCHAPEASWPRATPDAMRHRMTPAAAAHDTPRHRAWGEVRPLPERLHSVDAEHGLCLVSSRTQTPAEEHAAASYPPLRAAPSTSEHAIAMHSTIVAPQARRGAVWLQSRRRARQRRAAHRPGVLRRVASALATLAHPRQLARQLARRGAEQLRYWDEAFREPDTGQRCWRPPWLHAYIPLLIWLVVTLASTTLVLTFHTAVFGALDHLSVLLRRWGWAGRVVFGLMIFVTTFPPLPLYSTLVVLSGFAFGMWQGFVVSYVAALLGALAVFSLSRTYLHAWMTRLLRASGGLGRVVRAIEKQPRLLFLVRLAPYPYNLLNTLLASASQLRLRTYLVCTALALPKLLVHTALGASIHSFAHYHAPSNRTHSNMGVLTNDTPQDDPLLHAERVRQVAGVLGLALCIGIFVYLYRVTSRAVDDLEDKSEGESMEMELSDELEDTDKDFLLSSPEAPASPVWVRHVDTAPMLQRRATTPVSVPRAPADKGPETFAPSLFAPPADLGRSASLRAHQHRTQLSIADQIAHMERAVEDAAQTECG